MFLEWLLCAAVCRVNASLEGQRGFWAFLRFFFIFLAFVISPFLGGWLDFYFSWYYLFRHHNRQVNEKLSSFWGGPEAFVCNNVSSAEKVDKDATTKGLISLAAFFLSLFLMYFFFSNKFSTLEDAVNFFLHHHHLPPPPAASCCFFSILFLSFPHMSLVCSGCKERQLVVESVKSV